MLVYEQMVTTLQQLVMTNNKIFLQNLHCNTCIIEKNIYCKNKNLYYWNDKHRAQGGSSLSTGLSSKPHAMQKPKFRILLRRTLQPNWHLAVSFVSVNINCMYKLAKTIALSLGWSCTVQRPKFKIPRSCVPGAQNLQAKFNRRQPSSLGVLAFGKCWHRMDRRTIILSVLLVISGERWLIIIIIIRFV